MTLDASGEQRQLQKCKQEQEAHSNSQLSAQEYQVAAQAQIFYQPPNFNTLSPLCAQPRHLGGKLTDDTTQAPPHVAPTASYQVSSHLTTSLPSSTICPKSSRTHPVLPHLTPLKRSFATMLHSNKPSTQPSSAQDVGAIEDGSDAAVASSTEIVPGGTVEPELDVFNALAPSNVPSSGMLNPFLGNAALPIDDPPYQTQSRPLGTHVDDMPLDHVRSDELDRNGEQSISQSFYGVSAESSFPIATFKRLRSSADSDAGSSSCKDMDEPDVAGPDSVPVLVAQLNQLLRYVASKPKLQNGSASFMRDYLRTLLIQSSVIAEEVNTTTEKLSKAGLGQRSNPMEAFRNFPDELAKHVFSFLDGRNLAQVREVSRKWNEFACDDQLWKVQCLKLWKALETDTDVWKLIDRLVDPTGPDCWKQIYPKIHKTSRWKCRLQKTGRFICNLVAHQLSGAPLGEGGLPSILVVERRFNISHLQTFVLPEATVLYYEPEEDRDRAGYDEFIEYLHHRTRAGLALVDQKRYIFIPPCSYSRQNVSYHGYGLLGVVQHAYPPLAP